MNESGLYCLALRSNMPEAKSFKRWVTQVVLPSIRKYGCYGGSAVATTSCADAVAGTGCGGVRLPIPLMQTLYCLNIMEGPGS